MMTTEVRNNDDMRSFLERVDLFHDAMIRECRLLGRGYVDAAFSMHHDLDPFDVIMLVQTQFSDLPGVEIRFEGVSRFCVERTTDFDLRAVVENGQVRMSLTAGQDSLPDIVASRMRYRLLDADCLGPNARCSETWDVEVED